MKIGIRADANSDIGSGHIMRCLTLARALAKQGCEVSFLCNDLPDYLHNMLAQAGFYIHPVKAAETNEDMIVCFTIAMIEQFDAIVVDHYGLDEEWETHLKPACKLLVAIDDLADRKHACDILLDQTFGREQGDYQELVPDKCEILTGSRYALLREEFRAMRQQSLERRKQPQLGNILVSLGSTDNKGLLPAILERLHKAELPADTNLTIISSVMAGNNDEVVKTAGKLPMTTNLLANVSNMAELLAEADFAIGAAGTSTWERCCLGVPGYLFVIADNQKLVAERMEQSGAARIIQSPDQLFADDLHPGHENISQTLAQMSANAAAIVDGLGAERVAKTIVRQLS